jgi:hypothetical protein
LVVDVPVLDSGKKKFYIIFARRYAKHLDSSPGTPVCSGTPVEKPYFIVICSIGWISSVFFLRHL